MNVTLARHRLHVPLRLPALGVLLVLGACLAVAGQATTFVWNFDVPTGSVPTPHTYLDGSSTYALIAYGYQTQFESPLTANLGDTWVTGTITPNALYGKLSSPNETGLGLTGHPDFEIEENTFVQLDLSDLFNNGLNNLTMIVSSIQTGEGYYLWGSNIQGIPGILLKQGRNPANGTDVQSFLIPQFGTYTFISLSSTSHRPPQPASDVLIRNGLTAELNEPPNDPNRRCFMPVTFTDVGWSVYSDPTNPIIPGGMLYNRFSRAFSCFTFKGAPASGKLIVGGKYTITYDSTTASLKRLALLLGGPCGNSGKLTQSLVSPWTLTPGNGGGCLAVETIVLQMNVAYNDMRLMPRAPGYDLECFTLSQGLLKGRTVAEVFNIANALLSGDPPARYGLPNYSSLTDILRLINANYEFVDFATFNDRGYLIPNRHLGPPDPPYCPTSPMACS